MGAVSLTAPPSACSSSAPYAARIIGDGPWAYWRLSETSGTTAYDCRLGGTLCLDLRMVCLSGELQRGKENCT